MKYAFMSFSCPELSLRDMLTLARDLGYDGVEPRVAAKHAHGIETDASASERSAARDLAAEIGTPFCCVATSCRYADPATTQENVDETLRSIDLAADIGAPTIRVFGGSIAEDLSREAAVELVAGALQSVAEHAADRGVTVCMETHDAWCDPCHVACVMTHVGHPAVAVNWDIMHPIRRGNSTMSEAFASLKDWVRHVHFHDGTSQASLSLVPIGTGDIDHQTAVELLARMGYDGFLSGEWINWEPYAEHLPRELAAMKAYESSL
ncbi:MAG: sugar phosphate isomerase/epimerase [Lentisphaerae bacterium]|jgi:sugar phosphate isomerase/epimerase|nr:sugar phosphate isomerase/epimerase [Lentisphaerota bacterium]MBT4819375.1 sugar phosphate isomerase/epimerase [Lentisphaerota bacterium]MBT5607151.1 sugar phosphate isomerase/epimerase [Lentisphaerota bacterium]MBT7059481.1 sugar phosphate isomerase/epimerase [Lentisphaerota bacterium]MBT7840318.1 sugar phosphate isomerase/epimerase [Lentisphaerota bacterium]